MKKEPDAIAVLSSGIKQTLKGRWVSTDLSQEDDALGAPGGALRVQAVAILAGRYPRAAIVATGGKGYDIPANYPENRPLLCEILERELREAGISPDRIILERGSGTTYQQLRALSALTGEREWIHMAMVTNRWHIPRTRMILESKLPEFKSIITIVSAEEVLIANNPHEWESVIAEAYASEWLAERILKEEQGIKDIREGTYDFK
ncbi:MAG: YdcF family protein [bacterium]|nr:YdcF family protein [bacterium]